MERRISVLRAFNIVEHCPRFRNGLRERRTRRGRELREAFVSTVIRPGAAVLAAAGVSRVTLLTAQTTQRKHTESTRDTPRDVWRPTSTTKDVSTRPPSSDHPSARDSFLFFPRSYSPLFRLRRISFLLERGINVDPSHLPPTFFCRIYLCVNLVFSTSNHILGGFVVGH